MHHIRFCHGCTAPVDPPRGSAEDAPSTEDARSSADSRPQLSLLNHLLAHTESSRGWSNARIDQLIRTLKETGLNVSRIETAVRERAASLDTPTEGGP